MVSQTLCWSKLLVQCEHATIITCRSISMSPDALVFYINLYWKRFSETVALFSNALQKIGNCSDSHQLLSNNIQRLSAGASIMAPFCRPRRARWSRMLNKVGIPPKPPAWCIDSAFIAQTANPAIYVVKKRAAAQLNINSEARRWQTGFNLSLLCL